MPAGRDSSGNSSPIDWSAGASGIDEALADLPIFPLPNAVLFPRAHLELHIFEPRYRALLEASLEGHRCLAIAQIMPGHDSTGEPNIANIAGLGTIEKRHLLPDGRSHVVLVGRARVKLDELPFLPPFRRGRARIVADIEETPIEPHEELTLVAAIQGFVQALRKEGATVTFERAGDMPVTELAHHAAQHLLFDGRVKQELLEMRNPKERIMRIAGELMAQRALLGGPSSARLAN